MMTGVNHKTHLKLIAGVDEAGRGPLAGGVFAAAVILKENLNIEGINDSKKLSAKRRSKLAKIICQNAHYWSVAYSSVKEIDKINILQASLLAMKRAVKRLGCTPKMILVDGLHLPRVDIQAQAVVGGDAKVISIGAASILAKVWRDKYMLKLDIKYPGYGFACHKGYATQKHLAALTRLGVTPIHRRSFAPVHKILQLTAANVGK